MKKFNVLISETAQKQLYELDRKISETIKSSLKELGENPFRRRSGVDIKKLKGSKNPDFYRLRIGNFRAIYCVTGNDVKITEIIKRSKVYEWLD